MSEVVSGVGAKALRKAIIMRFTIASRNYGNRFFGELDLCIDAFVKIIKLLKCSL